MPKAITSYVCDACGAQSPMELGRCPGCGAWDTMQAKVSGGGPGVVPARRNAAPSEVVALQDVPAHDAGRTSTGDPEVDRALGGGWVAGAALLIAGEPGIGKSTLLLQLADHAIGAGRSPLYVAGEESLGQVKLRAARLGVAPALRMTRETDARRLAATLYDERPGLVIVDSIQTLTAVDDGTPGSLTQVRDGTALLTKAAKDVGACLVLIGHVTKEGSIAGPKVIEHMVDATLSLESAAGFRVLRANKNRFGPAGEVGVFSMEQGGMRPVENPSLAFLAERPSGVPGSVVVAALEGQRPLLLEVQALASTSPYSSPRRVVQGLDGRRVDVVLAVLERRLELPLAGLDVFVNVAGGLRLTDPGVDLGVAVAVYSAVVNKAVPEGTAVVGEVGLAGEVRSVAQLARRVQEARKSDHGTVVGPRSPDLGGTGVGDLAGAFAILWGRP